MGKEEGLLTLTEISSSEYKLEGEISTDSMFSLYISSLPTLPLASSSPIDSSSSYYTMSQHKLHTIIRQ